MAEVSEEKSGSLEVLPVEEFLHQRPCLCAPIKDTLLEAGTPTYTDGRRIFKVRRRPSPFFSPHFNYSDWVFFLTLALVTILSAGTRLYKLNEPTHVA